MPKPLNVLFVDDEPRVLRSIKAALKHNFTILTARSAYEAQAYFKQKENIIDVMVTDERMPETSGAQLIKWVNKHNPKCQNILLTGVPTLGDIKKKLEGSNYSSCLSKPWNNKDLIHAINDAFDRQDDAATPSQTLSETNLNDILVLNSDENLEILKKQLQQNINEVNNIVFASNYNDMLNHLTHNKNISIICVNSDTETSIKTIQNIKRLKLPVQIVLTTTPSIAMKSTIKSLLTNEQIIVKPISLTRIQPIFEKLLKLK